jgi:hypothetical protein
MEVHDTHSHEPVFCFSTIPVKEDRCLETGRKPLISRCGIQYRSLLPCDQPPVSFCWQRVSLCHQIGRTTSSGTDFFDAALGPYGRPPQSLLEVHDFQTVYGMDPGGVYRGSGRVIPRDGQDRGSMYEGPEWGAFDKSRRRDMWHKATAWEYWIPGCLSTSTELLQVLSHRTGPFRRDIQQGSSQW